MPYIASHLRVRVDREIDCLAGQVRRMPAVLRAGVLNYAITRLLHATVLDGDARYADHNEALGVLEAVKLEVYRRLTAPYEDTKIAQHGDVA